MRLIGINGFKTSGKDSTYWAIKRAFPDKLVQRVAFADKLKIAAAKALGLQVEDEVDELICAMDDCKEVWNFRVAEENQKNPTILEFSGRQYLQWFGQSLRNTFGESFWIDQVLPKIPEFLDNYAYPGVDLLVVTDVRYANEAERIRFLDGEVWEVTRPGLESDGHSSEIPLASNLIDVRISNDGTLNDLDAKVRNVLHSFV